MAKQAKNAGSKPNILILWGDDIGTWNSGISVISAKA
jgi:hypothetical protein